jgi:hypothetical protein
VAGRRAGRRLVRLHGNRELLVSPSLEQKRRGRPRLFSFLHIVKASEAPADTDSVSLTLHPPARVAAFVGALVLTGLAAVVLMLGRGALGGESPPATATAPPTTSKPTTHGAATSRPKAAAKLVKPAHVASGFPARIDHALRYRRVVVVSVSIPGAPVDRVVRSEARSAARASRAGFVAISALNERTVAGLVAKTGVLPDPAVVIVKRPGTVAATFSVADAGTIAQAVAEARR